jgi:ring-1,2-phenylacetyl-CoA epoxidase subunit PaaC
MAAHFQDYLLHLADNAVILGQRNAEWCGHGPVIEEDLALANNSLDLIGQARLLYQHVATVRKDGKTSVTRREVKLLFILGITGNM